MASEEMQMDHKKPKYKVFKIEEWERWYEDYRKTDLHPFSPPPGVDDAVVIRKQDIWSAHALAAYSGVIGAFCKAMRKAAVDNGRSYNDRLLKAQQAIADYFAEEAEDAMTSPKKFPD